MKNLKKITVLFFISALAFTSCSSDKNIEPKGDYEKVSFDATSIQNFKPIEHQKYLLNKIH